MARGIVVHNSTLIIKRTGAKQSYLLETKPATDTAVLVLYLSLCLFRFLVTITALINAAQRLRLQTNWYINIQPSGTIITERHNKSPEESLYRHNLCFHHPTAPDSQMDNYYTWSTHLIQFP